MKRVCKKQTYRDNIHNSLKNGAYYYKRRLEQRLEKGDREGINFDIASGLLFLAFSIESVVNFIGEKKVDGWVEGQISCGGKKKKQPFDDKKKAVHKAIGFDANSYGDVLTTVKEVKKFRDIMAHGKPEVLEDEKVFELKPDDDSQFGVDLVPKWQTYLDTAKYFEYYDHIMKYIDALMEASGISEFEQRSRGNVKSSVVE
jgi:hypothetical protein